jgi:ABC-2 type transporter
MYFGPRQDVRSYMESYGCAALPEMGTSEHILDCISRQPIGDETEIEVKERMERLSVQAREHKINLGAMLSDKNVVKRYSVQSVSGPQANIFVQFRLLLNRSLREVFRGKVTIILGLVRQMSTALIFGGIYNLGTNQASIQDRFGLLSLIAIGAMNMAVAQTIRTFPREKAIVANELASNMYRTFPYFVGKAISELPMVGFFNSIFGVIVYKLTGLSSLPGKLLNFLGLLTVHGMLSQAAGLLIGSISPNSDVALAMLPAVVVLNIIFDVSATKQYHRSSANFRLTLSCFPLFQGKNIAEESIPILLRWIPKVGLIRWGYEGLCLNEFDGLKFDSSGARGGPVVTTGTDALARFGLGTRSLNDVLRAQLYIAGGCWILSYIGLTLTRQKFLNMLPPKETES